MSPWVCLWPHHSLACSGSFQIWAQWKKNFQYSFPSPHSNPTARPFFSLSTTVIEHQHPVLLVPRWLSSLHTCTDLVSIPAELYCYLSVFSGTPNFSSQTHYLSWTRISGFGWAVLTGRCLCISLRGKKNSFPPTTNTHLRPEDTIFREVLCLFSLGQDLRVRIHVFCFYQPCWEREYGAKAIT